MHARVALALVALAACDDTSRAGPKARPESAAPVVSASAPPSSVPPPTPTTRPGPKATRVVVTMNGVEKTLDHAVAKLVDPSFVELRIGAKEPSCEKADAGSDVLTVWISNLLAPDGSRRWAPGVSFYRYGGAGPSKLTLETMDPTREVAGSLALDIAFKEENGGFHAEGPFAARGCGDPGLAPSSPGDVSMRVAGVAFPLRGAVIHMSPSAKPSLELGSSPCECNGDPCRGEVVFRATLDGDRVVDASLEGSALGFGPKKEGPVATAKVEDLDTATAKADLDWDFSLPTREDETKAYRLSLKGHVSLKVCKTPF